MHGFLRVRNWDRWQYRSDRNLPWIKVYRDLLLDPDFMLLTDVQKGHLVCIWLAASMRNGCIPDDATLVQRMISSEIRPDLDLLLKLQFLEKQGKRRRPNGAPIRVDKIRSDQNGASHDSDLATLTFERWYTAYPRREAKPRADKAWRKLNATDRGAALAALDSWPFPDDKKFIPLPASWLNARRWEDESIAQPEHRAWR